MKMQRRTLLIVLGALLITIVVVVTSVVFVWRTATRAVAATETIFAPQEEALDLGAVVTQVQKLSRLETASMRVMHVGRVTQTYKMVPNALGGDEITFLAMGDVIAGIDLSKLRQEDVWRSPDGTINMRLPPPQILVTRVDNEQSRVLTRKTGVLRRADIDLETRARQHAEANIRSEAMKKNILPLAARNAEEKLAELLRTLGAEKVRFVSAPGTNVPR
jgi:hypothetical protein